MSSPKPAYTAASTAQTGVLQDALKTLQMVKPQAKRQAIDMQMRLAKMAEHTWVDETACR